MDIVYNLIFSLLPVAIIFGLLFIVLKKTGSSINPSRRIDELEKRVEKLEKENNHNG